MRAGETMQNVHRMATLHAGSRVKPDGAACAMLCRDLCRCHSCFIRTPSIRNITRLSRNDWLTVRHRRIYSGGMISDFQDLSEKISQLAALTQALRSENAELRMRAVSLEAENAELAHRMQQAHDRVAALLEKIPAPAQDEEPA